MNQYKLEIKPVLKQLSTVNVSKHPLTRWEGAGLFETKFLKEFFKTLYQTGVTELIVDKKDNGVYVSAANKLESNIRYFLRNQGFVDAKKAELSREAAYNLSHDFNPQIDVETMLRDWMSKLTSKKQFILRV